LFVSVSFKIDLKAFRLSFLSFESRNVNNPQATFSPFLEESSVGKFSFIVSARMCTLSLSCVLEMKENLLNVVFENSLDDRVSSETLLDKFDSNFLKFGQDGFLQLRLLFKKVLERERLRLLLQKQEVISVKCKHHFLLLRLTRLGVDVLHDFSCEL